MQLRCICHTLESIFRVRQDLGLLFFIFFKEAAVSLSRGTYLAVQSLQGLVFTNKHAYPPDTSTHDLLVPFMKRKRKKKRDKNLTHTWSCCFLPVPLG